MIGINASQCQLRATAEHGEKYEWVVIEFRKDGRTIGAINWFPDNKPGQAARVAAAITAALAEPAHGSVVIDFPNTADAAE